jgi:hypothetical protein
MQARREKLEIVQLTFNDINVVTMKVKENMTTKAIDKVRFTKYNKILAKGTLKATRIIKQVHPAFQSIELASLDMEPCIVYGN